MGKEMEISKGVLLLSFSEYCDSISFYFCARFGSAPAIFHLVLHSLQLPTDLQMQFTSGIQMRLI